MSDSIELVRWIDSASVNVDWDSVDEVIDSSNGHAELYHQTAGFLIFEDETCIIITRDLQDAHPSIKRQAGDSIKIPKVAILSRYLLRQLQDPTVKAPGWSEDGNGEPGE